ncbi:BA75_00103T0 [Komagataella pastoris]|uniref:Restriction of telomere capping protein 5 n=1 Tax=Komagataella pastoris TaxID=4922 RepID=A0A1B2J689_PICPA|nr:BA75_00103T0 [Komagataella pastoris]
MGQSVSSEEETKQDYRTFKVSRGQLQRLFDKNCLSLLTPIEVYSIKENLHVRDINNDKQLSIDETVQLLGLPKNCPCNEVVYDFIRVLGWFPFFNSVDPLKGISLPMLIRSVVLSRNKTFSKLFKGDSSYKLEDLVFLVLSILSEPKDLVEKNLDSSCDESDVLELALEGDNNIHWAQCKVIKDFDNTNIKERKVSAYNLAIFLTFLLAISRPLVSDYSQHLSQWSSFMSHGMNLVRSFDSSITERSLHSKAVGYAAFVSTIETKMPNVLHPLNSLLESLLFMKQSKGTSDVTPQISVSTKLINEYSLAQLSTVLPLELCYSRLRKLYVGSESGFSMRSFESKCFNWNAPTITFISGHRIGAKKTKRYLMFEEQFPRSRAAEDETGSDYDHANDDSARLTFAVYLNQHWKTSNKEPFGDSKTTIFQLSPRQAVFKSSTFRKDYCYFNTSGGGIGFGNEEPYLKNNTTKYRPGNVSLTIDSGLEFCVFRHLGKGGSFSPMVLEDDSIPVYEDRFVISDLEVWGCGSEKELLEQAKRWAWEEKEAMARQRINADTLGEERAFLEMAGLVGNHGASGGSV